MNTLPFSCRSTVAVFRAPPTCAQLRCSLLCLASPRLALPPVTRSGPPARHYPSGDPSQSPVTIAMQLNRARAASPSPPRRPEVSPSPIVCVVVRVPVRCCCCCCCLLVPCNAADLARYTTRLNNEDRSPGTHSPSLHPSSLFPLTPFHLENVLSAATASETYQPPLHTVYHPCLHPFTGAAKFAADRIFQPREQQMASRWMPALCWVVHDDLFV